MRLVKLTQDCTTSPDIYVNPELVRYVRGVTPQEEGESRLKLRRTAVINGDGKFFVRESIEEVVAALTSPLSAARLAARL